MFLALTAPGLVTPFMKRGITEERGIEGKDLLV